MGVSRPAAAAPVARRSISDNQARLASCARVIDQTRPAQRDFERFGGPEAMRTPDLLNAMPSVEGPQESTDVVLDCETYAAGDEGRYHTYRAVEMSRAVSALRRPMRLQQDATRGEGSTPCRRDRGLGFCL